MIVITKDYKPKIGDVLSGPDHSIITIDWVYELDKKSTRVNKNYNNQMAKYHALRKIIVRKEYIWDQHKLDFKYFPEVSINSTTSTAEARKTSNLRVYLFYNDRPQFERLYESKYRFLPQRKHRIITGKKIMVKVNHSLCRRQSTIMDESGNPKLMHCSYWYGTHATELNHLIKNNFVYRGNLYSDYSISVIPVPLL